MRTLLVRLENGTAAATVVTATESPYSRFLRNADRKKLSEAHPVICCAEELDGHVGFYAFSAA
jgi:hypothetical protein